MKTWNIGNTTLRNPRRIRAGLKLLQELFEGKRWDEGGQRLFYEKLVERKLIETQSDDLPPLKTRGINGRKWAAAPNQLGLCRAWTKKKKGKVTITDAGKELIKSDNEQLQQEVFLRQLLKYQIPSPLEFDLKYLGFEIMPFRLLLKIIYELSEKGYKGVTKDEIALFIITTIKNTDTDATIDNIIQFR